MGSLKPLVPGRGPSGKFSSAALTSYENKRTLPTFLPILIPLSPPQPNSPQGDDGPLPSHQAFSPHFGSLQKPDLLVSMLLCVSFLSSAFFLFFTQVCSVFLQTRLAIPLSPLLPQSHCLFSFMTRAPVTPSEGDIYPQCPSPQVLMSDETPDSEVLWASVVGASYLSPMPSIGPCTSW